MPEMSGLEATVAIREKEKKTGKHQLIIALTAHAMKGDRERCLEAGMDEYLVKPVQSYELFAALSGTVATRKTTVMRRAPTESSTQAAHSIAQDMTLNFLQN